jgi:hypothetical protein
LKLKLIWHEPAMLRPAQPDEPLIYACDELDRIPPKPGIYVFARRFGHAIAPLYVGQALRLRKRIKKQLNNAQLMKGIESMENGQRMVLIGEFDPAPGQQAKTALNVLEKAYIESALSDGFALLNKQGTVQKVHTIESRGKKAHHKPFPRRVNHRRT